MSEVFRAPDFNQEQGISPFQEANMLVAEVCQQINGVFLIEKSELDVVMASLLTPGGHILFEGPAGTGKSMLAESIAASVDASFGRIQGQPGLMPANISGKNRFDLRTSEYRFFKGPIFKNIPFADEINRTQSKTQAAFLEPMAEGKVTIDDVTYEVPEFSFMIATQNPKEHEQGTNPLVKAQLDRFMASIEFKTHNAAKDVAVINKKNENKQVEKVASIDGILRARKFIAKATVDGSIVQSTAELVDTLRMDRQVDLGSSALDGNRSVSAILGLAKSAAFFRGDLNVEVQDVRAVAPFVLRHRTEPTMRATRQNVSAEEIIDGLISKL